MSVTKIWATDTEDDSKGNPYLINFYDGKTHHTFRDNKKALQWLEKQPGTINIWATNLGYDLNNLFKGYWHAIEIVYVGSRVISAQLKGCRIYFKCTLNQWKLSVKEMGLRIGLKKIETKDFNNIKYCQRDTEITYRFVISMKETYEKMGCRLKTTIGSTALEYYYNSFADRPSGNEILSKPEIDFCRQGFYGGRTEIFFTKPIEGSIHYVDINSLYPYCLKNHSFPALDKRRWTTKLNLQHEGIADVEIDSPNAAIPYLPNRSVRGLIFPCGILRGHYTYFEIREAVKLGYRVKKVHKALEFFGGKSYPFTNFVDTLYAERQKAQTLKDDLMADSCKLLMNNLYGKFGQGCEHTKLIPIENKSQIKHGDLLYGSSIIRKFEGTYQRHSNGIWACYTTAYARDILFKNGLKAVEKNGGLLIYCDTDSVIYESSRPIIPTSNSLGDFKLVDTYKYAHFKLPKLYCLILKRGKNIYRAKGVPRVKAKSFFKTGQAKYRRPYKLREVWRRTMNVKTGELKRNLKPKNVRKLIPNFWDVHEKETRHTYNKRRNTGRGYTKALVIGRDLGRP